MKVCILGNLFKTEAVWLKKKNDIFKTVFYIDIKDVIYIENYNRRTMLVAAMGEFLISAPFKRVKELLDGSEAFVSGHCSYLANKSFVRECEESLLVLENDKIEYKLPVTRRKLKMLRECLKP